MLLSLLISMSRYIKQSDPFSIRATMGNQSPNLIHILGRLAVFSRNLQCLQPHAQPESFESESKLKISGFPGDKANRMFCYYTLSQNKLCKIDFVRTLSNFHQFR